MKPLKLIKSTLLLSCFFVFFFSLMIENASSATYYVSPKGSDKNAGSFNAPFKSIQKAADTVNAGDTVKVGEGTYYERIKMKSSGAHGQQITFQGERSANGDLLTILDGGDAVSGWKSASELGNGVYKTTNIGYKPYAMILEKSGMTKDMPKLLDPEIMAYSSKKQVHTQWIDVPINYWDGVEALYYTDGTTTYIRFRDYDDPNSKTIRSSPEGQAILIDNKHHITVRDFLIRSSQVGVKVIGTSASNNIIEYNHIMNGQRRVIVDGASDNIIRNNIMEMGRLSDYAPGAWHGGDDDTITGSVRYKYGVREHYYNSHKHEFSASNSSPDEDAGIEIDDGSGNEIYSNEIYDTLAGILIDDTNGVKIYGNTIHNISSVGIVVFNGVWNAEIYDNLFYDINVSIRFPRWDDGDREMYIYRNRFWNPTDGDGIGSVAYFHYKDDTSTDSDRTFWFYHNSVAGGEGLFEWNAYACNHAPESKTYFVNNIFSSNGRTVFSSGGGYGGCVKDNVFANADYNWVGHSQSSYVPDWLSNNDYGNNIQAFQQKMWSDSSLPDFSLGTNSTARAKGIDLSQQFTINGQTYSPLRGMQSGYFSGSRPDMGAIGAGESKDNTQAQTCTSFTYTAWSECLLNGTQTRKVTPISPEGCTIDNPKLVQECSFGSNGSNDENKILQIMDSPIIDGDLSEFTSGNFLSLSPSTGGNSVIVKMLWNSDALYLGFLVSDTQLNASATNRDGSVWNDDAIEWFIDTNNDEGGSSDPNTSFMLPDDYHGIINILNTQYDSQGNASGMPSSSWNGSWQSAVELNGTINNYTDDDTGYTIEVKIPWTSIGYSSAPAVDSIIGLSVAINDKDDSDYTTFMLSGLTGAYENASQWQKFSPSDLTVTADMVPPAPPTGLVID